MPQRAKGTAAGIPLLRDGLASSADWRRLATAFYARVGRDPLLRPLFPGKTFHCAIEELAAFLTQIFGGPSGEVQRRWWISLKESHARFRIGPKEREAWMKNMDRTLDESAAEPVRRALKDFFSAASVYVVNTERLKLEDLEGGDVAREEIARGWESQLKLDETVERVRQGDTGAAIAIVESGTLKARFETDQASLTGLLDLMLASGEPAARNYARERLEKSPSLAGGRFAGRTLLHMACGRGDLEAVRLLLSLGANPNARDNGDHAPLYWLANGYRGAGGAQIVGALIASGAGVDDAGGVKRCTALHMAARRGAVETAAALLDHGAEIEARDSAGDTPLRRAINCGHAGLARLLVDRGASAHSTGSKGLTPVQAARTPQLKAALKGSQSPAPAGETR
ncbi:MAG: ankyrin repeat domain-containing protein [Bryobacterales bacterium]|nr:ankyrin repeat domain-containing protein [Bryobacterales bacterium]